MRSIPTNGSLFCTALVLDLAPSVANLGPSAAGQRPLERLAPDGTWLRYLPWSQPAHLCIMSELSTSFEVTGQSEISHKTDSTIKHHPQLSLCRMMHTVVVRSCHRSDPFRFQVPFRHSPFWVEQWISLKPHFQVVQPLFYDRPVINHAVLWLPE